MTEHAETFEEWRERTAPSPARPLSRRKRMVLAAVALAIGLLIAVPGSDHKVASVLLVLALASAIALSDDAVPRWLQVLVLLPLGCLGILFSDPSRSDWIGYGVVVLLLLASEVFMRWREKRR